MSDTESSDGADGLGAVPGVARLAATARWHTTEWSVGLTVRATRRALEVAMAPERAAELVQDIQDTARTTIREVLGIADVEAVPVADMARRVAETVARTADRLEQVSEQRRAAEHNGNLPLRA